MHYCVWIAAVTVQLWPRDYLFDDRDLSEVSSCAALYKRDVCCQAHPIHMITSGYVEEKKRVFCFHHFYMLGFLNQIVGLGSEVKFEYLCYLKRSSPTQTSWRTPHCSQGFREKKKMTFQLKRLSKIMKTKKAPQ